MGTKQIRMGTTPPYPLTATSAAKLTAKVCEGPELDSPMTMASPNPTRSNCCVLVVNLRTAAWAFELPNQ
jgi:hypothetical protein